MLNKITFWFLNRAYTQLEAAGVLQNADNVAEFLEDYYAEKCK
jgi:DNA-binding transcriptional regulator YhcF (GntR family)